MPCKGASVMVAIPPVHVAPFRAVTVSDILLLPFGVKKDGGDDLGQIAGPVRAGELDHFAHTVRPVQYEPHGDPLAQIGRMIAGGDAPLHILLPIGIAPQRHGIGPVRQDRAVRCLQPHKLPPLGVRHMAAGVRAFAQIVVFLLRQRPMQAQILRDHRAIGLVPDHDKAFFGAQDVQRFGAVGHHAQIGTHRHQRVPERLPLAGTHGNLIAQLARE
mmetsp:Transcript_29498/g.57884  ORF Transcript_29498/g.57884 Transcript_29498/m.57884 type:complete len:216 (-) Transcript_29498:734-1381(-)